MVLKAQEPTHYYCEICKAITGVTLDPLTELSYDGLYRGGDVVCNECSYVIATRYKEKE